jgi:hypothetical protein
MLIIGNTAGPSSTHGTGVFTTEDVAEGQVIWLCYKVLDPLISAEEWEKLPEHPKQHCKNYMYWSTKLSKSASPFFTHQPEGYVMCGDNAKYFNHSPTPNTGSLYFTSLEDAKQKVPGLTDEQWEQVGLSVSQGVNFL